MDRRSTALLSARVHSKSFWHLLLIFHRSTFDSKELFLKAAVTAEDLKKSLRDKASFSP